MITFDLLLPSFYHLQRIGAVSQIKICALDSGPLKALKSNKELSEAFPEQDFIAFPPLSEPEENKFPELYKELISSMKKRQIVVVAMPDHLHFQVIMEAINHDQHILCVKPLVLNFREASIIEKAAFEKGLFIGIEYHKRFDRRSLMAKKSCESNLFGEFVVGEAKLIEPYYYRNSNFQNWFTCDKTDPFVYIGCHYVDLVYYITGLKPVGVSVSGIKRKFPNGLEAYMWTNGRIKYENNAILSVINGLGYPDEAAGSNDQGIQMFFEGNGKTGMVKHNDQFRGVEYCYLRPVGCGGSFFNYINPDFFRLVPWEGKGYKPVGYGPDSVSVIVNTICNIEKDVFEKPDAESLTRRHELIREINRKGIIATPANSYINELVIEASRYSIVNDGKYVDIIYKPYPKISIPGHEN